ncbi:MAG: response regulator transcription factor [Lachnospiraceae bacterium]|nr:response regulator transcription factor [Lachnospiraceae bacterium]
MNEILIVDDNEEILTANRDHLTAQGFNVTCADTGIKALALLNENRYDCLVLDILLPDLDGFTICKAARTITNTPVLFLSCLDEIDDKVNGLLSGGDDYMTKPYSLRELTARIHALLRRSEIQENNTADVRTPAQENIIIDRNHRSIFACGKNVLLSDKEFKLFTLLYDNQGAILSKEEILKEVWHNNAEIGIVAVWMLRLRRKIEFTEEVIGCIETIYGIGYRLIKSPHNDI